MRTYALFLVGIGAFFGAIAAVYWFFSYEDGGFLMLIGATLLGLFPGSYYLWWSYHRKGVHADDDPDADVAEGAGDIGAFPASSIWPFLLGMGAMFACLTFVFGLWMAPIAAALLFSGAVGGTVESRQGGVARRRAAVAAHAETTEPPTLAAPEPETGSSGGDGPSPSAPAEAAGDGEARTPEPASSGEA